MLHTVNKSPFEHSAFSTCLKFAGQGSTVLLIEADIQADRLVVFGD
jgi:sulfur relay protein TusB/DsrH